MIEIAMAVLLQLEPPKEYVYEPKQAYTMQELSLDDLNKLCPIENALVLGCAVDNNKIYIAEELSDEQAAIIIRHEKAHLNGWYHHYELHSLVEKLKKEE